MSTRFALESCGYNQRDTKHKHHTSKSHFICINLTESCLKQPAALVDGSVIKLIFIDEIQAVLTNFNSIGCQISLRLIFRLPGN